MGASLPSTLVPNPFQLPANPITGAASLVQGTFDAGLKGLTSLSEQTIANAPSLPIVLPNGQLSIVQGGLDGLNALQNDAHKVLEGAPKLPGVFDMATGAMGAVSDNFLAGGYFFSVCWFSLWIGTFIRTSFGLCNFRSVVVVMPSVVRSTASQGAYPVLSSPPSNLIEPSSKGSFPSPLKS